MKNDGDFNISHLTFDAFLEKWRSDLDEVTIAKYFLAAVEQYCGFRDCVVMPKDVLDEWEVICYSKGKILHESADYFIQYLANFGERLACKDITPEQKNEMFGSLDLDQKKHKVHPFLSDENNDSDLIVLIFLPKKTALC
jgi:hypothetical protein